MVFSKSTIDHPYIFEICCKIDSYQILASLTMFVEVPVEARDANLTNLNRKLKYADCCSFLVIALQSFRMHLPNESTPKMEIATHNINPGKIAAIA